MSPAPDVVNRPVTPRIPPTWLSSAAHRQPGHTDMPAARPWGLVHARRVGDLRTACGINALGWPYFWDLPFTGHGDNICAACIRTVGADQF